MGINRNFRQRQVAQATSATLTFIDARDAACRGDDRQEDLRLDPWAPEVHTSPDHHIADRRTHAGADRRQVDHRIPHPPDPFPSCPHSPYPVA